MGTRHCVAAEQHQREVHGTLRDLKEFPYMREFIRMCVYCDALSRKTHVYVERKRLHVVVRCLGAFLE